MKRLLIVAVASLGFCNVALAEQSAGFIGVEVGYGEIVVPFDYALSTGTEKIAGDFSGGGVYFGFVGGYKQFFNPYFGLRYYANVNVFISKLKQKITAQTDIIMDEGDNHTARLVNYGVNIDMLVNFIASERNGIADFGAFIGLGIGGNNWSGKAIDIIDEYVKKREAALSQNLGWKSKRNFLDVGLNVGLRTNIALNHGLELAFRVPLLKNTFLDEQKSIGGNSATLKVATKTPSYNVTLRYMYSFGAKQTPRKAIKKRTKQYINGANQAM